MKKLWSVLVVLLCVMLLFCACDVQNTPDQPKSPDGDVPVGERKPSVGLAFQSNGDGTCYVSGIGTCTDTDVVIPTLSSEDENGEVVVAIDKLAFESCSTISSITIPDSVTTIGVSAFQRCKNLKRVELGAQITYVGTYAFKDCTSLTDIVLPDTLTEIEEKVFKNCTSLKEIVFPGSLAKIGKEAFANCTSLTELVFPGSLTCVSESAFMSCTGLTDIVFLTNTEPQEYNSIRDKAFYGCENLSSVVFSDRLCHIGSYAFDGCKKVTAVVIPDSVESIAESAFSGCSLAEVTIGRNVELIRRNSFPRKAQFSYNGTMAQCYAVAVHWFGLDGQGVQCTDGVAGVEIPKYCPCGGGDVPIHE